MAKGVLYGVLAAFTLVLIFAVHQSSKVSNLEIELEDTKQVLSHTRGSLTTSEEKLRKLNVLHDGLKERAAYKGDNAEKLTVISQQLDECRLTLDTTERDLQESKADLQELAKVTAGDDAPDDETREPVDQGSDSTRSVDENKEEGGDAASSDASKKKAIEDITKLTGTLSSKLGACIQRRNQQATQLLGLQRLLRSVSKVEQKVEQAQENLKDQVETVKVQVKQLDEVKESAEETETKEKIDTVETKLKDSNAKLEKNSDSLSAAAILFKARVRKAQERIIEFQKKQSQPLESEKEEEKEAQKEAKDEEEKQETEDKEEEKEEEKAVEVAQKVTIAPVLKDLKNIVASKGAPVEVKKRLERIEAFARKMDEARRAQINRADVMKEKREVAKQRQDLFKQQQKNLEDKKDEIKVQQNAAKQKFLDFIAKKKKFAAAQQRAKARKQALRQKFVAKGALPKGFASAISAVSPLRRSDSSQQEKRSQWDNRQGQSDSASQQEKRSQWDNRRGNSDSVSQQEKRSQWDNRRGNRN